MYFVCRLDASRAEWEAEVQAETANPLAELDIFDSETDGTTSPGAAADDIAYVGWLASHPLPSGRTNHGAFATPSLIVAADWTALLLLKRKTASMHSRANPQKTRRSVRVDVI